MGHIGQLTEGEVEQEIQNAGKTKAPRLTPELIDVMIQNEHYWVVPNSTTTVCALQLTNSYVVVGKAACINPENFDAAIGRKVAYDDARNQIWALEGYALCSERLVETLAE